MKTRKILIGLLSMFVALSISACNSAKNNSVESGQSFSAESSEEDNSEFIRNSNSGITEDESSESTKESSVTEEPESTTYTLTFKLNENDGGINIVIESGKALESNDSRIPPLPICDEIGYYYAWDKDFSALTESNIVTAIKKAKTYTVYLDTRGGALDASSVTVTFGEKPNIPAPTETPTAKGFMGWYYGSTKLDTSKAWSIDQDGITLNAVWREGSSWTGDYN